MINNAKRPKKVILNEEDISNYDIDAFFESQEKLEGYFGIEELLVEALMWECPNCELCPTKFKYEVIWSDTEPKVPTQVIITNIKWEP